jgi:hypothetical protein
MYSDYSLSLFTLTLKIKVAKWKQTLSATYHVIKMVVYVQTFVQIITLFQTYIKEYCLKSTRFSTPKQQSIFKSFTLEFL